MLVYVFYTGMVMLATVGVIMLSKGPENYFKRGGLRVLGEKAEQWEIKRLFKDKYREWEKSRNDKTADKEIYEAISFLRNIISIDRGKQVGTDFIIEQLSQKEGVLQGIYIKMLSLLRVNKRAEAQKLMADSMETTIGKEFSGLLIRWDDINPLELSEILLSHQKSIKEIRMTRQRRKDETISDILYFPVIINVVLIFINFIYVGYFIDQKETLQMLF